MYVCPVCKKEVANLDALSNCIAAHKRDEQERVKAEKQKEINALETRIDDIYNNLKVLVKQYNEKVNDKKIVTTMTKSGNDSKKYEETLNTKDFYDLINFLFK